MDVLFRTKFTSLNSLWTSVLWNKYIYLTPLNASLDLLNFFFFFGQTFNLCSNHATMIRFQCIQEKNIRSWNILVLYEHVMRQCFLLPTTNSATVYPPDSPLAFSFAKLCFYRCVLFSSGISKNSVTNKNLVITDFYVSLLLLRLCLEAVFSIYF